MIAAIIASVTVHDLFGYAPAYQIPNFQLVSDWELVLYLMLGWVMGHTAPVFLRLLDRARRVSAGFPGPWPGA